MEKNQGKEGGRIRNVIFSLNWHYKEKKRSFESVLPKKGSVWREAVGAMELGVELGVGFIL